MLLHTYPDSHVPGLAAKSRALRRMTRNGSGGGGSCLFIPLKGVTETPVDDFFVGGAG